jgi:TPR repeat protein
MSDPMLFRAEDSLLDQADAIQAYKWYRKAAEMGQPSASGRLDELSRWASEAAASGNSEAAQLLLNIQ